MKAIIMPITVEYAQASFEAALQQRKKRTLPEILIVEDEAFSSKLLINLLNKNYRTYLAASANEGVQLYMGHAPDIVFLDLEMPEISGHAFAETIQQLDKEAFIIVVSSCSRPEDIMLAKKNGARGFVVKPYDKERIFSYIDKYIATKKLSEEK
jgi:two-component system chemotaxis response regulator CheY